MRECRISHTPQGGQETSEVYDETDAKNLHFASLDKLVEDFVETLRGYEWVYRNSIHVEEREVGPWTAIS